MAPEAGTHRAVAGGLCSSGRKKCKDLARLRVSNSIPFLLMDSCNLLDTQEKNRERWKSWSASIPVKSPTELA